MANTPVTGFTRPLLKSLTLELEATVAAFAAKHGLTVQAAGASFDAGKWTAKLAFTVQQTADGTSGAQAAWNRAIAYNRLGLTPELFGREFTANGKIFTLIGYAPGRSRFPFIGQRTDGKQFKFTEAILVKLGVQRPAFGGLTEVPFPG